MNVQARIELLAELGNELSELNDKEHPTITRAIHENPWFTPDNVCQAIDSIRANYLDVEQLQSFASSYRFPEQLSDLSLGIIMAGNIPLVGFHDMLCAVLAGVKLLIKTSERDHVLIQHIVDKMIQLEPHMKSRLEIVERLKNYDAVVATGSDTSSSYFAKYFANIPHIIRGHRNAVAVVRKQDTAEELKMLGHDIFDYFGLGCRNVSKLYLQRGVSIDQFYSAIEDFEDVIQHNKYKNNYDYNYALFLMNKLQFFTNGYLLLKEDESIHSRIASVHYEWYDDDNALSEKIRSGIDQIQCVVSASDIADLNTVGFGQAQSPKLDDYADGIDTMQFLSNKVL